MLPHRVGLTSHAIEVDKFVIDHWSRPALIGDYEGTECVTVLPDDFATW